MQNYDVVIIGGGAIGSSIAYFLKASPDFFGEVAVVECDPGYIKSSTPRSLGGVRQQFSNSENIEIGLFGQEFVKSVSNYLTVDGDILDLGWRELGYLFLASVTGEETLVQNQMLQKHLGACIDILHPKELRRKFPWLNTDGITIGSFGAVGEGWLDPSTLLNAFRSKARSLGVTYLYAEAIELIKSNQKIVSVKLGDGTSISCDFLVNAAGAWAGKVSNLADIKLPVVPKKRIIYGIDCREKLNSELPLVIDPSGVFVRSEGDGFVCGVSPPDHLDPDSWDDMEVEFSLFDEIIWPSIANRIPAFEAIKVTNAWAGWYDYNTFDQNGVIGPHPEVVNFFFANGFSGHGLQQAPAVGRAIMELITQGAFQTIDLTRFGYERIIRGQALPEKNIV
jgi:FAD-dependent oxidoreductase domain-containing protein 1